MDILIPLATLPDDFQQSMPSPGEGGRTWQAPSVTWFSTTYEGLVPARLHAGALFPTLCLTHALSSLALLVVIGF